VHKCEASVERQCCGATKTIMDSGFWASLGTGRVDDLNRIPRRSRISWFGFVPKTSDADRSVPAGSDTGLGHLQPGVSRGPVETSGMDRFGQVSRCLLKTYNHGISCQRLGGTPSSGMGAAGLAMRRVKVPWKPQGMWWVSHAAASGPRSPTRWAGYPWPIRSGSDSDHAHFGCGRITGSTPATAGPRGSLPK
jgi:hypothetical protein